VFYKRSQRLRGSLLGGRSPAGKCQLIRPQEVFAGGCKPGRPSRSNCSSNTFSTYRPCSRPAALAARFRSVFVFGKSLTVTVTRPIFGRPGLFAFGIQNLIHPLRNKVKLNPIYEKETELFTKSDLGYTVVIDVCQKYRPPTPWSGSTTGSPSWRPAAP
jgi:hypothetical protein